jgi:hypothetical protein
VFGLDLKLFTLRIISIPTTQEITNTSLVTKCSRFKISLVDHYYIETDYHAIKDITSYLQ